MLGHTKCTVRTPCVLSVASSSRLKSGASTPTNRSAGQVATRSMPGFPGAAKSAGTDELAASATTSNPSVFTDIMVLLKLSKDPLDTFFASLDQNSLADMLD